MKKRKSGSRILAAAAAFVMLFGSMTVFAAERPAKSDNPTWGDVWALQNYMDEKIYAPTEEGKCEWFGEDEDLNEMAPFLEAGKILIDGTLEGIFSGLNEEFYCEPPEEAESVTELADDQAGHYSELYDAAAAALDAIVTATGEKYLDDILPGWENVCASDEKLWQMVETGKIMPVDISGGMEAPDAGEMEQGTYWVDEADLNAYGESTESYWNIAGTWESKWESGYNGMADIERSEMLGVISGIESAYSTLLGKLHEGEKTASEPVEDLKSEAKTDSAKKFQSEEQEDAAPVLVNQVAASDGTKNTSKIDGVYGKTFVAGAVYSDDQAKIRQAAGLSEEEIKSGAVVKYYICSSLNKDINEKLSKAVSEQGYKLLGIMNNDLYKMDKGKITPVKTVSEPLTMIIGVPENLRSGNYEFAVMCCDEEGNFALMQDLDADKATITVQAASFGYWAVGYKTK